MKAWLMLGSAGLSVVSAAPVRAPSCQVGDKWIFDQTDERGTRLFSERLLDLVIERVGGETMIVGIKRDGAPESYEDHEVGSDWSIRRIFDGEDVTTTRPFIFPMVVGKTWTIDYTDPTRRGMQTSVYVHRTYRVVGWEDVSVPAGTFHAIRVESSGIDRAMFVVPSTSSGSAAAVPGATAVVAHSDAGGVKSVVSRFQSDFYYVPSVRNYVKSMEERYNSDEVLLSRETRVMVSFHPGTQSPTAAPAM